MQPLIFSQHTDSEWLSISIEKLSRPALPEWEKALWRFILEWYSPRPFIAVYTSGSTGKPKELQVSKEMMRVSAGKTLRFFNLKPSDSALLCLSASYIAGKMMIVRAIVGGLHLYVTEPSSMPLKDFHQQVTFTAMVPMQVFEQLKEPTSFNGIEKLLVGGGAVSSKLSDGLQTCSCAAYESYGMTETVSHVALRCINGEGARQTFVPMTQVSVLLDDRQCLVINAPDLLSEPIITNDRAKLYPDGSFRIVGRIDNVINSGGIKIQPEEVEQQIASFFHLAFAISSVPDSKMGEKLVLVVEEELSDEQVSKVNKLLHESYHRVHLYVTLHHFPQTGSHKLDRPALKRFLLEHLSFVKQL
ncbi:MAG: AMP-binding protein [Paludibacteraceae bacterium]|nr:AMP-binding protein [Paludibacteraceae bacterium]